LQGRYKAILIDKEAYAMELSRYIHLNPIRARVVNKPEDYCWSSYRDYIGTSHTEWIDTEWLLTQFGKDRKGSQERYKKHIEKGLKVFIKNPIKESIVGIILGREEFVNHIKEVLRGKKAKERDLPALRKLRIRPTLKR